MKRSFTKFARRLKLIGLYAEVEKRAFKMHVTLQELYEGPDRAPSIAAARRAIYTWLMGEGKGKKDEAPGDSKE